jgi:hypothetical protein
MEKEMMFSIVSVSPVEILRLLALVTRVSAA